MSIRTFPAVVAAIHDGDTLTVRADLGFMVWEDVHVRLAGCNAAELNTDAGKAARDHLAALAPPNTAVTLICLGPDKYGGRWQGGIILPDGVDVAEQMIADGYAAVWNGKGTAPVPPWPIPEAA